MLQAIKAFILANQTLSGFLGVALTGFLTVVFKGVPKAIYEFIVKYTTTSLSIGSANESFYTLMELLESEKLVDKTRRIKIFNGRWGGANQTKGLGLGTHWFIYKRSAILITITEQQSTDTYEKLTITLTKFGRSHKLFNDLLVELGKKSSDIKDGYTNVRRWISDSGWGGNVKIPNRKLDTIFIEDDDLNILLNTIRQFKESQQWYLDNGIPYQLGILLSGPPGTGKTSLIKALAAYFKSAICTLPAVNLNDLNSAIINMKDDSLLVIEDIDRNCAIHKTDEKSIETIAMSEIIKFELSDVLNSLDGFLVKEGRILIITANDITKIDPAVLRAGRIDLKVELGYVSANIFSKFMKKFFPSEKIPENWEFSTKNLTTADLQNEILMQKDAPYFINKYCKQKDHT